MHSSTRTNRLLAAATPVGAALVSVGTAVLVAAADEPIAAIAAILAGILIVVVGMAGVHGLIADRYGGIGYAGFLVTQVALVSIFLPLKGLGYLVLIPAGALLSWALVRMDPPLRGPALAVIAVWPAAALLDALTPLEFAEALALVFVLPYAWLALAARSLPVAVQE
jgi:hypothetical protein